MGKKILLIDDEQDFTELAGTLLGFHDFDVDTFNDSVHIDDALENKTYDLVVTDLMMPTVDGFEIIKKLRNQESYQKTPIICLSAKTLTDDERKFLLQNDVHFIMKPFEPHELLDHISQLVEPLIPPSRSGL